MTSSLETLLTQATAARRQAGDTIDNIAALAKLLECTEIADDLRTTATHLRDDTFRIIVMGRFKNGKSTLLNALMGGTTDPVDLGRHKGPMVVDDLPATAVLTGVHWARTPSVVAIGHDGSRVEWPLEKYLKESVLDVDEEESQRRFGNIREFEMGYPAKLCAQGVTIYDSPGLDDVPVRTMITREATKQCDAAVVVFRSDVLMGHGELMQVSDLVAENVKVFTVINLWNGRVVDDRLRGFVWNRYLRDNLQTVGGWTGQDLTKHDVYFVDAERSRDARYDDDEDAVQAAGLAALEQRLGNFLLFERQQHHLGRFKRQVDNITNTLENHIRQRQEAARVDRDDLRQRYEAIKPQLEMLRERPKEIPTMFRRCLTAAQPVLVMSFTAMVAQLRADLPAHLDGVSRPSGETFLAPFKQKEQLKEASEAISAFTTSRIDEWGRTTAPALLEPLLADLHGDIEKHIASIERQVQSLHLDLTGWHMDSNRTAAVGTNERIFSTLVSVLTGDAVGVLTGGMGGWRGAAGSAAGAITAGIVMGLVGVTSAVVFWPVALGAAILAGIVGSHFGLDKRVKRVACDEADKLLEKLPTEAGSVIENQLRTLLDERQLAVVSVVAKYVADEERTFGEIMRLNEADQAERERALASLSAAEVKLATFRKELSEAVIAALQG
jgi:hypothetical protein